MDAREEKKQEYQNFTFNNGMKARIKFKQPAGEILDMQVLVSEKEYKGFLKHFNQKNISPQTSCYTYVLQAGLTQYNYEKLTAAHGYHPSTKDKKIDAFMDVLRTCSEDLVALEALINNPSRWKNGHDNIQEMRKTIQESCNAIVKKLQAAEQTPVLKDYIARFQKNQDIFLKNLDELDEKTATPEQIRLLFGIQDETSSIHSLGNFIADQVTLLADCGIQQTYWITDSRLSQLFATHPAIKALSQVKSTIERRAYSIIGARYNNSRDPVPKEMLAVMRSSDKDSGEHVTGTAEQEQKGWFSLQPYLSSINDFEEVDKMLCFFTGKDYYRHKTGRSIGTFLLLSIANIVEVFIYSPIHVAFSAISFLIETASFRLIDMSWLDNTATFLHENFSIVSATKRFVQKRYQRTDAEPEATHKACLEVLTGHVDNFYNRLISAQSGHKLATQFFEVMNKFAHDLTMRKVRLDLSIIFSSSKEQNKQLFQNKKIEVEEEWSKFSKQLIQQVKEAKKAKETARQTKDEESSVHYHPAKPWGINELNLPGGDFLEEMLVVLADEVIDHSFRNAPGLATTWFITSAFSWSVLMFPSLSINQNLAWAKILPSLISKGFTGKEIADGFASKQIATFMLWKVGFFTTEAFMELTHGNGDVFFKDLFRESEKISLGMAALIFSGMALQFMPKVPDINMPYLHFSNPCLEAYSKMSMQLPVILLDIFDALREESETCGHGAMPFNLLEYSVLSLKLGMFLHSSFSSGHTAEHKMDLQKLSDLTNALAKADVLECKDEEKLRDKIKVILPEIGIAAEDAIVNGLANEIEGYIQSPMRAQLQPPASTQKPPPEWIELQDALRLINQMENLPKNHFGKQGSREALLFYNHLDTLFENYNNLLRAKGQFHKLIDKHHYLDPFYNKYCYNPGMPLFRLLSISPLPPFILLTYAWRGMKYLYAGTDFFSSPAVTRQVEKSFSKDAAIAMQLVAMLGRPLRSAMRVVDYLGRMVLGIGAIPLIKTGLLSDSLKYDVMKTVISLNLHHASPIGFIRPWFAQVTRDAGTSSAELRSKSTMLLERMDKDRVEIFMDKLPDPVSHSQTAIESLLSYDREAKSRVFQRTSPARNDQVAQLSEIWQRGDLKEAEKKAKTAVIIRSLPQNSVLRKKMTQHTDPLPPVAKKGKSA